MDKPEDVWKKAMKNALVYGTGFVRFDSMGGISVVDPKDYHYLEKKEWVGIDEKEVAWLWYCMGNRENINGYDFAKAIEAKLKEKNGG